MKEYDEPITDRLPTEDDADENGKVWFLEFGHWLHKPRKLVCIGDPWLPRQKQTVPLRRQPKACPWCGGKADITISTEPFAMYVNCHSEECGMSGPWQPSRNEAIDAWDAITIDKGESDT